MPDTHLADTTAGERPVVKPRVLVLGEDLMFAVRIEKTLEKLGYAPVVLTKREEILAQAREARPALIIINFASERLLPALTTEELKALPDPAPILGFVSHTFIPQVRPNAMRAGADLLVANSAMAMRLPQLVAKLAPLDGSQATIPDAKEFTEEGE